MVVGEIPSGTDVVVIGGGPAGYVCAIRAGQLDLDVTLVEADRLGGTCLTRGCIPSKALLSAADRVHRARTATGMGIYADPEVDFAELLDWKDGVVDTLVSGVETLCRNAGVRHVEGRAEFVGEHRARVIRGNDGGAETVEFDHAVIATGSRPVGLDGFGFDEAPVLDAAAAMSLEAVPERLVVVGAGYIGMELSTAFAKLGAEVTVLESLEAPLPGFDDELARPVVRRAGDLGVEVRCGQRVTGWREADGGGIEVLSADGEGETAHPGEAVVVCVGREPVTDTVGLGAVGLEPDDDGFLATDDRTRTIVEHVLAVGDVAGEPLLAHKAMAEGLIAAEVIAGLPAGLDFQAVPAAVFTDPEIATVGLTPAAAESAGFSATVGRFPFAASGRALAGGRGEGFVRIVADEASGFVLGGQIVGPEASELIAEVGLAIELGATLEDVYSTVHTHPTLAEAVKEAAEAARGRSVHGPNR